MSSDPKTPEDKPQVTAVDQVIEDTVETVLLSPGHAELLIIRTVGNKEIWLVLDSLETNVKVDDIKIVYPDLLLWLADHECRIKAWPQAKDYGAVVRAEFTSTAKK